MFHLTQEDLDELNNEDRKAAFAALREKRTFASDESRDVYAELISYFKNGGLFLYKPASISWEQAFLTRKEQMCTLDAILCDYDGCGTVEGLKGLVKEAQTAICNCIICYPTAVWAGAGLGKELELSEYEMENGFNAYDVGFTTAVSGNHLARIPYETYAVPQGIEDKHGCVLRLYEAHREIANHYWHVCDYMNAMSAFVNDKKLAATNTDMSFAADGSCAFAYGGYGRLDDVPTGKQTDTDYDALTPSEKEFYELNELALDTFAKMLRVCDELSEAQNDDPGFWKAGIDDIIHFTPASFWAKIRELNAR